MSNKDKKPAEDDEADAGVERTEPKPVSTSDFTPPTGPPPPPPPPAPKPGF